MPKDMHHRFALALIAFKRALKKSTGYSDALLEIRLHPNVALSLGITQGDSRLQDGVRIVSG